MQIQQQPHGALLVLKPVGPLVEADASGFRTEALSAATKNLGRVVVDVSAVPFVDSAGIEALVDLTEHLRASGRALKLSGSSVTLRNVLELTGWSDSFEFFNDVNSAVRSFL